MYVCKCTNESLTGEGVKGKTCQIANHIIKIAISLRMGSWFDSHWNVLVVILQYWKPGVIVTPLNTREVHKSGKTNHL